MSHCSSVALGAFCGFLVGHGFPWGWHPDKPYVRGHTRTALARARHVSCYARSSPPIVGTPARCPPCRRLRRPHARDRSATPRRSSAPAQALGHVNDANHKRSTRSRTCAHLSREKRREALARRRDLDHTVSCRHGRPRADRDQRAKQLDSNGAAGQTGSLTAGKTAKRVSRKVARRVGERTQLPQPRIHGKPWTWA